MRRKTKVAILHDCWTCSYINYLGLFGMFIKSTSNESEVIGPLLSVSPMSKSCTYDPTSTCSSGFEKTEFDSQTQRSCIRAIFEFYDANFSERVVC